MLPYHLTVCGLDELDGHAETGVSHVISIIDPEEPTPAVLRDYPELREHWVLRFHDVSRAIPGARAPQAADVADLLAVGAQLAESRPSHLLVHCHAGVSRSAAAAVILMAREAPGREREAFETVYRLRPIAAPNQRMIKLADAALERGGALSRALDTSLADRLHLRRPRMFQTLFGR
ncbi:Predicted protein tyrosine phosphatase [Limimonas halophila]|uniref:Tyrosine specific protein phosphatases domain-containing protein n=1 Tax=Limimonas halophila TaxID=1082479 RepID=A0A1G7UAS9_9PROT|nr:dual specificity protein phosphatase family protein [Limimonas halophila]SDG44583.1 Predicted protein tyrosine phosphatase [Limimonas halophila]